MSQVSPQRTTRRGRLFPEYTIPLEELARRQGEDQALYERCRAVFEQVQPELIKDHYNWFIVIEPDSRDYFIDIDQELATQKASQKHPDAVLGVFRLNEIGACGRI
ncbi:MAG: hypothetical protein F6K47_05400 [Symploca sp. SIO2E6]|nr:hypothetical protein [Symploca sp. SIO2E6]